MMRVPKISTTLYSNATFSGAAAIVLMIAPDALARWMGEFPAIIWQVLGAGLLIFALDVFWVARRLPASMRFVKWIFMADVAWVAVTPIVMLAFARQLGTWGHLLLLDVGLVVALFAYLEWRGLSRSRASA